MDPILNFRSAPTAQALLKHIRAATPTHTLRLMEVCGGHTMAIWRHGIPGLLGDHIRLLSGPGCPVCVTPNTFLDRALALSRLPEVILTTFGDLMRVPGSSSDLQTEKARGADIRPVYSAYDALALAQKHPEKIIIFLGVGFETTAPTIAAMLSTARDTQVHNLRLLSALKTMPQALRALAASPEVSLDGLILPGHVSAITGSEVFEFLADEFHLACVVSGFEALDILQSLQMLIAQLSVGRLQVQNQYSRTVKSTGNAKARAIMCSVFEPEEAEWRGLGNIPGSGLKLREEYNEFDAFTLAVQVEPVQEPAGCLCAGVIRGAIVPEDCPHFGATCTPERPLGACMVSEEGTCAAHYKYQRLSSD